MNSDVRGDSTYNEPRQRADRSTGDVRCIRLVGAASAFIVGLLVIPLSMAGAAEAATLCSLKKGGPIFLRDACKKRETALDPVALGLQGPTGPKGDQGPQGPPVAGACTPTYTDNGDGTASESCTTLQWEKKQNYDDTPNPADPHDADNTYTWSEFADADDTNPDGTAFFDLLAKLNTPPCFAGHCDWRLPDVNELRALLLQQHVCTLAPQNTPGPQGEPEACVASLVGPTVPSGYWSVSTYRSDDPTFAWNVSFFDGAVGHDDKNSALCVRAVRNTR